MDKGKSVISSMDKDKGVIEEPALPLISSGFDAKIPVPPHAADGLHGDVPVPPLPSDDLHAHIPVPQDMIVLDISRKSMLRQILPKIGAVIRTEAAVKVGNNKTMAWVSIEFHSKPGSKSLPEVQDFQSLPCKTYYDAEENVSEQAICYFISRMNVCINDLSYPAFKETYRQLHHFMAWSHLLQTRYDTLRVQTDNLLKSYRDLLDRLGGIYARYSDVLSLAAPLTSIATKPSPGVDPRYIDLVEKLFSLVLENAPTCIPSGSD